MSAVTIRKGAKEDITNFHRLYKKLIASEKMTPDPELTDELLIKYSFHEKPFFEFLLAELPNASGNAKEVVGVAMYYYQFSTFAGRAIYMEALYVEPEHQKKGIGKALWQNVVRTGLENNCVRCIFNAFGTNKNAIGFYKKHGAVDMTEEIDDHIIHMTMEAMTKFASH